MSDFDSIKVLHHEWAEYELLDSGNRLKLERFKDYVVIRSEPKAWWRPRLPESAWKSADARYFDEDKKNAGWQFFSKGKPFPVMDYKGIKFRTKLMEGSKHLGIFPEQQPHWDFVERAGADGKKLLNLFGYTGAASLIAAKAGYAVTHVDASTPSNAWARQNQELSGLSQKPIRWITDDALKFANREVRRGETYDAILLDPPAFGRGPKNELWKLEKMLPELMQACAALLSKKSGSYAIATLYSIDASAIMAKNVFEDYFKNGLAECGELALPSKASYPLPLSIWARFVRA